MISIKKISLLGSTVIVGLLFSGCSLFNGNSKFKFELPDFKSKKTTETVETEKTEKKVEKKEKGKAVKKAAVLPSDREQIAIKNAVKTYTPEELRRGVVKGDWAIETVDSMPVVGEEAPFLKFVPDEKRVYGNNGCNVINAKYIYNPSDSTISFSDIASTMRLCSKEGITDTQINIALDATRYYSWEMKDSDYYLYFYNENHKQVMSLMHRNFQFLNGTWHITAIDGKEIDVPDMKIVIDVDEGKLHGNTGCNIINGKMEIDMDAANSISFQAIAMTRMACPDQNHETSFIVALEEASAAKPTSSSTVILYNSQGREVLRLERSTDTLE